MVVTPARTSNRTAYVIREAIGAVANADVCDRILACALATAGETDVPEERDRLRAFVVGALFASLRDALGLGAAELVVDQIGHVLVTLDLDSAAEEISEVRAASAPATPRVPPELFVPADQLPTPIPAVEQSGDRPSLGPDLDAQFDELLDESGEHDVLLTRNAPAASTNQRPTDPAPGMLPVVLLASRDRDTLIALRDGLTGGLDVISVDDPIALLDALQSIAALAVIVVDARNPTVQPATMAAMAPDLPRGVQVLLWGVTPRLEAEINALGEGTLHWVGCEATTPPEEVAFLCVTMLRDMA
jgi:hypothetical protein